MLFGSKVRVLDAEMHFLCILCVSSAVNVTVTGDGVNSNKYGQKGKELPKNLDKQG